MKPATRPTKVLIVEDDDDTRLLMLHLVRSLGLDAAEASNAREALAVLRGGSVGAILTDYAMAPISETGSWMLQRAQHEGLLSDVRLMVICTGTPHVEAPASVPEATVTSKPMDVDVMRRLLKKTFET